MRQSEQYNSDQEVSHLSDFPGADVDSDFVRVAVINGIKVEGGDGSNVNPATEPTLDSISKALDSRGIDSIRVVSDEALDVSAENVTVEQESTVSVQEQEPMDVSASVVTVDQNDTFQVSASELESALASNDTDVIKVKHDDTIDISNRADRILGNVTVQTVEDSIKTEDSDRASASDETVTASGSSTLRLSAEGASNLLGRVSSDSEYTVELSWKDESSTEIFRDEVAANVAGGEETEINAEAISPDVDVIVSDTSGEESVVNGLINLV